MSATIRAGRRADVPTIAELIRGLARYEGLEAEVTLTEERLESGLFGTRSKVRPPRARPPYAETLIAESEGQAVGFALFFHSFSTFLAQPGIYLEDLFVIESHRGQGIGRSLLAKLAEIAVERECGRLEWSVLDWNKDAIGFYERLGARPNSGWTVYRLVGDALTKLARE
jgi:GNAT superfamily N-acetyltransferase